MDTPVSVGSNPRRLADLTNPHSIVLKRTTEATRIVIILATGVQVYVLHR